MLFSKLFTQLVIVFAGISVSFGQSTPGSTGSGQSTQGSAGSSQSTQGWLLEKMPPSLETEYALSSLPPRLREASTVYLLDPQKGYYMARKGSNGFSSFVMRTQWEKAEFLPDMYSTMSYDEEGTKTFVPMYFDVAAMRATGKFSPAQIRDSMVKRIKEGRYKAPSRTGISYMLGPISRAHGDDGFTNSVMPHYMFYAPRVDDKDIGGAFDGGHSPFAISPTDNLLDKQHSIFNLIILPAGDAEKAAILEQDKGLLERLAAYKPYLKIAPSTAMMHHR
jgi:hypothetical protein